MVYAGLSLARRIEAAEAANARDCTPAESRVILETNGGLAVFAGRESPLTQVVGIGLNGGVSESDLDRIEAFFHDRGARVNIDLCPLADQQLLEQLRARNYRAAEFNNVLVREMDGFEVTTPIRSRRIGPDEVELWSRIVGEGFFNTSELSPEEMNVGRAIFAIPGVLGYLTVNQSGEPAGGAAMTIRDGLATLFADGTIRRHRQQGVQQDLIRMRLADAVARHCDLATATTQPGSTSQRNYERAGFQVAYTKLSFIL
jgi:hypothetical protein